MPDEREGEAGDRALHRRPRRPGDGAVGERTPLALIEALRPDVLVKGADWAHDEIVGRLTPHHRIHGLAALTEVGAGPEHVVRTRMFVTNIERDWQEIGRAHHALLGDVRPATSMVEVARLIEPWMLVEVEGSFRADDRTGVATRVRFEDTLEGPISAPPTPATAPEMTYILVNAIFGEAPIERMRTGSSWNRMRGSPTEARFRRFSRHYRMARPLRYSSGTRK